MINKFYLDDDNIANMKKHLAKNSLLVLDEFISKDIAKELLKEINALDLDRLSKADEYSYHIGTLTKKSSELVNSLEFKEFIQKLLSKKIRNKCIKIYKWQDYKIANDLQSENKIKILLDLTINWDKEFGGNYYIIDKSTKEIESKFLRLTIINFNKNTKEILKYINNHAKDKKRIFIEIEC